MINEFIDKEINSGSSECARGPSTLYFVNYNPGRIIFNEEGMLLGFIDYVKVSNYIKKRVLANTE